jgi:hypothetical protein
MLTCKKESPVTPTPLPSGPDTTSHNFTFTQYTFSNNGGSSYLKDVAIVNDSDIWAVGAIYATLDTMYNAVHWNGQKWQLLQLLFYVSCGDSQMTPYPINSVFSFNPTDVWFSDYGEMIHWTGTSFEQDCSVNSQINGAINRIWGTSSSNLFVVGNIGTIVHYNGTTWTKQSSGTTIDLHDVWGTQDGSVVWACGYATYDNSSILLKYDGSQWKTIWTRPGRVTPPYVDFITSIWGDKHLFSSTNYGVYTQNISGTNTAVQSLPLPHFPYSIRGSAENNVAVVGDLAMIWHYNGTDWKSLNVTNLDQPLYSVAVSTNTIVGVGADYDLISGLPLIYLGKRISQ